MEKKLTETCEDKFGQLSRFCAARLDDLTRCQVNNKEIKLHCFICSALWV